MKPTPRISSERRENFPFTDCNYQPTSDASYTATEQKRGAHPRHGFWRLGAQFHGGEAVSSDATDFVVFTILALVCCWPIASAAVEIAHVLLG